MGILEGKRILVTGVLTDASTLGKVDLLKGFKEIFPKKTATTMAVR